MKKGDNHKLMHPDMGKLAKQYSPLPGSPGDTMDPKNATSQSPIGSVQAPSIYNDHHQNYSQMNIVFLELFQVIFFPRTQKFP